MLNRNSWFSVNLHGGAKKICNEHFNTISRKNIAKPLLPKIKESKVGKDRIYNAYQTGLFHKKLESRTFVKIQNTKRERGVKQMRSKERVTIMFCTSVDGRKVPLSMIGKSKNST